MKFIQKSFLLCLLCSVFNVSALEKQRLYFYIGQANGLDTKSRGWQGQYEGFINQSFSTKLIYLNEGNFDANKRDGYSLLLNYYTPSVNGFNLSLAAGPYYFNNTDVKNSINYQDNYGFAMMMETGVNYESTDSPFIYSLMFQRVWGFHNINSYSYLLGMGYEFDQTQQELKVEGNDLSPKLNKISAFWGLTIMHSIQDEKGPNYGLEYQRSLAKHFAVSLGWNKEQTDKANSQTQEKLNRNEIYTQVLLKTDLTPSFSTAFGFGPAYLIENGQNNSWGRFISIDFNYSLNKSIGFSLNLDRMLTSKNTDSDVLRLGINYNF